MSKSKRPNFGKRHIDVTDSSLVKEVHYDPKTNTLDAVFHNGKRYRYIGVVPLVFAQFVLAESMGKFFNAEIKTKYECKKVRIR